MLVPHGRGLPGSLPVDDVRRRQQPPSHNRYGRGGPIEGRAPAELASGELLRGEGGKGIRGRPKRGGDLRALPKSRRVLL